MKTLTGKSPYPPFAKGRYHAPLWPSPASPVFYPAVAIGVEDNPFLWISDTSDSRYNRNLVVYPEVIKNRLK
ncbi:MAG: hypothetical protein WA610_11945, partial [Thermodesulfovibrionales bacterium]